jgi:hypothetical protein
VKRKHYTMQELADVICMKPELWWHNCHAISLAIVQARVWPGARVARGFCAGVGSQHSWIVIGRDCYAENAAIVDPTLWSYRDDVEGVWYGTAAHGWHHPHGEGSIWDFGRPPKPTEDVIELAAEVSDHAHMFLELCSPTGLDRRGWGFLANAPVGGWPAAEIYEAMWHTPELKQLIPIDRVGMLTDLNPSGLYLPAEEAV